ncbi:TetR family transcriptional regulator C-terminal domain-containing protein [Roseovarius sp.]|uniref:TetR family transcriptional regulator C-terminal domain-containing protein n=1 Tax=Roseovarius sp. TaxID=1486281 RepID=UPI003BA9C97D
MAAQEGATRPRKERKENADKRRGQIIEATYRSIVRNGLSGTTLASVSNEAGLSQGVAVFYFQNKQSLLGAALRHQYEIYQENWQKAVSAAGPDPADQITALVKSDFTPESCTEETLIIWHAFWGESKARPLYGEISKTFEQERAQAMCNACAALLQAEGRPVTGASDIAAGIDAMTDGLWLGMYLSGDPVDLKQPMRLAAMYLSAAFPAHAEQFRKGFGVTPKG